jgi:hypothetical protein
MDFFQFLLHGENAGVTFGLGQMDLGKRLRGIFGDRKVNLPHDYMIESDVYADAPSGPASGYYNAGVAHYAKEIKSPRSGKATGFSCVWTAP